MTAEETQPRLLPEAPGQPENPPGPVECLGQTFASEEERREHYLARLRELLPGLRKRPDFPKGSDEDTLQLSDPPWYTACPNPFLEEFVQFHGRPYDPDEPYHREPVAGRQRASKLGPRTRIGRSVHQPHAEQLRTPDHAHPVDLVGLERAELDREPAQGPALDELHRGRRLAELGAKLERRRRVGQLEGAGLEHHERRIVLDVQRYPGHGRERPRDEPLAMARGHVAVDEHRAGEGRAGQPDLAAGTVLDLDLAHENLMRLKLVARTTAKFHR